MEELLKLIASGNITAAYELFKAKPGVADHAREYNNERNIRPTQVGNRQDKIVKNEVIALTKIAVPFQRKIVRSAASFLFGSPIKLVSKEEQFKDSLWEIRRLWRKLRMDPILLNFCKVVKAETEGTIVFFHSKKEGQDPQLKARVISNKNGKVYPLIDSFGDMVAFGWEYVTKEGDADVSYLYVWTDEKLIISQGDGSTWTVIETQPNLFGKIPVVYMTQDQPEWWEVQQIIDRFEMRLSKWADTNDYFGSPMYKAKGGVSSFPKKDDQGKMVKLDIVETDKGNIIEADLDVLSWDSAPESTKMELDMAKGLIFGMSDTPDLTFDSVKGLGSISGVALELLFFGSIIKAKWDQGDYETAVSRCLNIIKAGMANIMKGTTVNEEMDIDVEFTSILPENLREIIEILSEASGGKPIMSQTTAMRHNPLVDDVEEEKGFLDQEAEPMGETLEL